MVARASANHNPVWSTGLSALGRKRPLVFSRHFLLMFIVWSAKVTQM